MQLSDDSLLKPLREMAGMPAPGEDLGDWYHYDPDLNQFAGDSAFAPACTFGQWVSALARIYAITGDEATPAKVLRPEPALRPDSQFRFLDQESLPGILLRQAPAWTA